MKVTLRGTSTADQLAWIKIVVSQGRPSDRVEATRLYEIACTGKDASACHTLGNS